MSLDAADLFALMPAVYRTRDAANGGPLQALFEVIATQTGIVEQNIEQLYDDQFITTCMPWVIPYIGDLIGYNSIYQTSAGLDSRAEVANTIGYRRRKGTPIALQQVAMDVSGRPAVVVEEFRRLITTQSLRLPRPHHVACIDLRRNAVLDDLDDTAFDMSNRTLDVRRIAPRMRDVPDPDPTPLDIALHGPGRINVSDIAVHLWLCSPWQYEQAPAFVVDARRFKFNALGLDIPLFSLPPAAGLPFTVINTRLDVPQPIRRGEFLRQLADFYGQSMMLFADGAPVAPSQICCANLADRVDGNWCAVAAGKIAIDPELGRIQYAADLTPPQSLRVTYVYGFPAAIGGGPYDRTATLGQEIPTKNPAQADFFAQVGTSACPDLEAAVAQWNLQPAGSTGVIVLPGFERYVIDLTGANAITLASGSTLAIAAAVPVPLGGPRDMIWNNACVTLLGDIDIAGMPPPMLEGEVPPVGQLIVNGLLIEGQIVIGKDPVAVQLSDCTLVPGLGAANPGLKQCEPGVIVENDATLCVTRCITGPIAANQAGAVRLCNSMVDATSPCCVAYAGSDGYSAGADLHVEDSTIIGKVRTRTMRLASNTIFFARLGRHDPWPAALWCSRRQDGCIRFCSLPTQAITPRCYECLPPDPDNAAAFAPSFITLRYGLPAYGLLSGDVPMAVWHGADNGSQMGVYHQIQETEAVSNVQIRTPEYLPVLLESGLFLHPSRPLPRPELPAFIYYGYYSGRQRSCCDDEDDELAGLPGIGANLL
ncbi:hypothetical protein [Paraburkholderia sp. MM5384-R2]|uniref:hypothetical protein n=1 Tax=Paraburkholderia sp. MM5384-R2 TaxID=2723097 RepID=UPI00162024BD|nr:hypothetical protein [Paraburkholderia sp. MM5384-R2]MBB5503104.1 hypothetical protein [Paraburkholderia sp. MM5384-R2]